ncbi:MAG TPA: hypothetical protein VKX28_27720 [Xanthobacteraceae bacterium]|nr:hypothetical protein [Xanthobacteraceae bacterium]
MFSKLVNCIVVVLAVMACPALAGSRAMADGAYASVGARPMAHGRSAPTNGQAPAPRDLAARIALPACGFAAIESEGPNGFQYCDDHNLHGGEAF